MTDALRDLDTGLLNEDYFRAALPNRVATARRGLRPVSVALLALDRHEAAPAVAYALQDTLRDSDTACRLDADRFGLLLEDTPEDGALWTVQRVRQLLTDQGVATTVWGGVASYPAHALEPDDLLSLAEEALASACGLPGGGVIVAAPSFGD